MAFVAIKMGRRGGIASSRSVVSGAQAFNDP